jgi:hypothetical protein
MTASKRKLSPGMKQLAQSRCHTCNHTNRMQLAVRVTVHLTVPAQAKHRQQMRRAAAYLSPVKSSIRVSQPARNPKQLTACFKIPKARQVEVVDHIGRQFGNVENYSTQTIAFGP